MSNVNEAYGKEFIERYFHAALQEDDVEAYVGLFTEDGVLEDPVGMHVIRGQAALRQFILAGREHIASARATVHEVYNCGEETAARWTIDVTNRRGETITITGIGVFIFAGPGKVRQVREFHDGTQLMRLFAG